jgi:penicillin-binding protein A
MDNRNLSSSGPSPLLQRASTRNTSRGLRIPRRGRIRVALVVGLVLGAIVVLRSRSVNASGESEPPVVQPKADATKQSKSVNAMGTAPAAPRPRERRAEAKAPPLPKPPRDDYTFEEVSALLQGQSLRLHLAQDTLEVGRRRIRVHYSIDTALQNEARILLHRYHPKYGAMAMVEAHSGRVLLLASYVNDGEPFLGRDLYCRSLFPAASVFKIVTAAAAIERGKLTPESELRQVGRNHTLYSFQLEPELKNHRTITLKDAFAYSINPVFGRIGIYVLGGDGLREYADRFGFGQPIPFELHADSATVGNCDSAFGQAEVASGFNQDTRMSPLFGALLGAAVCGNGIMTAPRMVDSMVDARDNRRIYAGETRPWRLAAKPETAGQVKLLMREVIRYGTARESFRDVKRSRRMRDMEYGGKTGSVDRDGVGRVDWFVGFLHDPSDERLRVGVAVVTVHGAYWTVHSSYLAAQMLREHVRETDKRDQAASAVASTTGEGDSDG